MLATTDRARAIAGLDEEHAAVRLLIDALTDDEMTRPDTIQHGLYADQQWSFKDLLAHLITYEAHTLEAIEAFARGEKPPILEALATDRGSREIHDGGVAARRDRTLAEALEEWNRTQASLIDALRDLSDEDWRTPAPFPADDPTDLGGVVETILVTPPRPLYRHLPVHIPDAAAYVRDLRDR